MYSLEELIKTFQEHTDIAREQNERLVMEFMEDNPEEDIPAWFRPDFMITLALKSMCEEILRLKNRMDDGDLNK